MFWKKGLCLPPNKLGFENELCTAWTFMSPHLHHPSWEPQTCQAAPFFRDEGVCRVNRSGNRGHLLVYLSVFWAVGFCWLCYYSSNWQCRMVVLSSESIPVVEGVILCNVFEQLLKKRTTSRRVAGTAVRCHDSSLWRELDGSRRTVYSSCTCHLQYSTNGWGRAWGRRVAWQPTAGRSLGCHGDKQGCLHQRQISAVGSRGHTCRSTNSNGESSGPEMRKGGVRGRNAFSLLLGVPSQSLFPSRAEPHCRRRVPVQQGDKDSLVQQLMTPLALLY